MDGESLGTPVIRISVKVESHTLTCTGPAVALETGIAIALITTQHVPASSLWVTHVDLLRTFIHIYKCTHLLVLEHTVLHNIMTHIKI